MAERKLRLLCIDGGGVRGLSALFILKQLMEAVNRKNPPKPCNYFDMIGGTSTGGLIAVMLGRLKMDINVCINVYNEMMDGVFRKERHRIGMTGGIQARFSTQELERSIKKVIIDCGIPVDTTMRYQDSDDHECKVFVCAVSAENRDLTVEFTSYTKNLESNSELMDNVKIWEACRATSAATSFFDPMPIGRYGQVFLDGATSANNPVSKLWLEAGRLWGGSLESKVQCLVSLGTGKGDVARFGDDAVSIGKTLMAIATQTERTANDFRMGHSDLDDRNAYYRFNVEKGLEKVGLEDAGSRTEIATMTQAYMTQGETFKTLRQFQKEMTATNVVRYTPLEPRPCAFAFLSLDDSPKFLRRDSDSYWECLTIDALSVYESIYSGCANPSTGFVSLDDLHQQFDGNRPRPELVNDIWQRIERREDYLLPKNLTLAIIYMLHVETFMPDREHKPISINRRQVLECFGNWISCVCGCGRKWNFAGGPQGMRNDISKTKECKVTKWEDAGSFKKKLLGKRKPIVDLEMMDRNRKSWLHDRQFPRVALSAGGN